MPCEKKSGTTIISKYSMVLESWKSTSRIQSTHTVSHRFVCSRLNKSKLEDKEKLVDLETQAKLGDSEVVLLRYQVQRLTSKVDSISTHSQWLESELQSKKVPVVPVP
jgi:hypothetical protein